MAALRLWLKFLGAFEGDTAARKTLKAMRALSLVCFGIIPSLGLGFLTLVALWLGVMQFVLLKWGQAPDPQFIVLGVSGTVGLWGLWILVLVPTERLRRSNRLRSTATLATGIGMLLALLFLSRGSLYGWTFGPRLSVRSVYLLGAPLLLASARVVDVWRPPRVKSDS